MEAQRSGKTWLESANVMAILLEAFVADGVEGIDEFAMVNPSYKTCSLNLYHNEKVCLKGQPLTEGSSSLDRVMNMRK